MAISDSYATAAEYRARVTKTDTGDDTTILSQLTAVSRWFELECERFFGIDAAVVARVFDGNGLTRLYIDDVATLTGLVVKADLNGDYDYADSNEELTINTHFWAGPVNAALEPEPKPYRYLDIVPNNGRLSVWPEQLRAVQVTAKFGWPSVPGAVKEAVILVTRQLRDAEEAGHTLSLENIDMAIPQGREINTIVGRIKGRYGKTGLFV